MRPQSSVRYDRHVWVDTVCSGVEIASYLALRGRGTSFLFGGDLVAPTGVCQLRGMGFLSHRRALGGLGVTAVFNCLRTKHSSLGLGPTLHEYEDDRGEYEDDRGEYHDGQDDEGDGHVSSRPTLVRM